MRGAVENTGVEFTVTEHLDLWSLKRESGLDGWTMVDCSVGADGLVYLLFSGHVPERINGMFVDTRANAHYRGIGLAVDWQDGTVLGWEPYDFGVQEMNFHFIQPIGEDILLLGARSMCYRDGSVDQNAVIVDKNGRKLQEMCLGDGIQSCAVACDGRIITSYFDEGVFGNFGWDRPVGSCGLIVWDRNGQPIWKNKTYPIWDCYAMNLDDQENLWFYYYSEFNLVRMNFRSGDRVFKPQRDGMTAFLITASGRGILTDGGYGDHSQFHYYELRGQELRYKGGADIVCEGKKLLLKQYRFRGSKAVLLDNQERLFCREIL